MERRLLSHKLTAPFLVLADYTVSRAEGFSSDRAVRAHCDDIWDIEAVPVTLPDD
jgi:hypothetical protein